MSNFANTVNPKDNGGSVIQNHKSSFRFVPLNSPNRRQTRRNHLIYPSPIVVPPPSARYAMELAFPDTPGENQPSPHRPTGLSSLVSPKTPTRAAGRPKKSKGIFRIISALEEEAHPLDREITHENQLNSITQETNESEMQTEDKETDLYTKYYKVPDSPTYVPSKLNPENQAYYREDNTPSPTSSCTSSSGLTPYSPGFWNSTTSQPKRKMVEERFEPYPVHKRQAISPGIGPSTPPNAAARKQIRGNSLINIQNASLSFSQMRLS